MATLAAGREASTQLEKLKKLADEGAAARRPFERDMYMNLAFYQGEQWLSWAEQKFGRPQLAKHRSLFVDNRVMPAVLAEVARMTKKDPAWDGVPASGGNAALSSALMGVRTLKAKWWDLKVSEAVELALEWAQICGTVFMKRTWNPEANDTGAKVAYVDGQPVMNPITGMVVRDDDPAVQEIVEPLEATGAQLEWQALARGDVALNVRSPFDIYVDPLCKEPSLEKCRWLIEVAVRDPDELYRRFGVKLEPDAAPTPGLVEARMPGMSTEGKKSGVTVWELWERPTSEHPKGRHAVWTKHAVLAYEANPTKGHGLPYDMYVARRIPGRFWGGSLVDQIRPLNRELNKSRSQMRDNATRIGNPALVKSRDDQNAEYTGAPGEIILVDPMTGQQGGPITPQYLQPPSLPGYVQQEPALISDAIDRGAHQSEVSRGMVPSGVTAASAIQLLQEADQTIIAYDARRFERWIEAIGQGILALIAEFYTDDRLLVIAGEDETWDVVEFRGGQWKNDVPTVRVKAGSLIPESPAARQAQMYQVLSLLVQHGYPIDPISMAEFLRAFEAGGLERLVGEFSEDGRQVAWENQQLAAITSVPDPASGAYPDGVEPPPVNPWDNHEAHKRGIERVMKSRQWQLLSEASRQAHVAHWKEHDEAIKAEELRQAMLMQAGNAQTGRAAPQPNAKPSSADAVSGVAA